MQKNSISKSLARQIILKAQFLNGNNTKMELIEIINSLGYIQIDTISVINRAHHHILWTRERNYDEADLNTLQTSERAIFEYWGHAMSYLPMSDYRYFLPKMKKFENPSSNWAKHMLQKGQHVMQPVIDRIKAEGPLSAKDFTAEKIKGGTWWDWKPAKIALELLFWKGDLMITERKNFQKVYDLKERVLPDDIDTTFPTSEELGEFLVLKALNSLGIASEKEIRKFLQPGTIRDADIQLAGSDILKATLKNLTEDKKIELVQLEGEKERYYTLKINGQETKTQSTLHLLSPFDNLIIQRDRVKTFFDFDYTIECYVPEKKRKYGYFVLPILWGENLVGRLDPKADRKTKTLIINNLYFEPWFEVQEQFLLLLANKLVEFARFNKCEKIELGFRGKSNKELKQQINKAWKA